MKWSRAGYALLLLFAVAGCKKAEEKRAEKAVGEAMGGQAKIDPETGKVEVTTKGDDGKETKVEFGPGSSLPPDFPKSVPIYPGSKIMASVSLSEGKSGHQVTLTTPDSPQAVIDYYKKNLTGFKQDSEVGTGDTKMLMLSNPELSVSVSLSRSDNETVVQLTVSKNS